MNFENQEKTVFASSYLNETKSNSYENGFRLKRSIKLKIAQSIECNRLEFDEKILFY
jgi:hypothetical protein